MRRRQRFAELAKPPEKIDEPRALITKLQETPSPKKRGRPFKAK